MLAPQDFEPELDAIFDQAQDGGVSLNLEGDRFVLLSQKSFDTVLTGSNTTAEMVKHVPVPRTGKPITYILTRAAFDDLVRLHQNLLDLIKGAAASRTPQSI